MALNRKTLFNTGVALAASFASIVAFPVIADQASDQRERMEWRELAQDFVSPEYEVTVTSTLALDLTELHTSPAYENPIVRDAMVTKSMETLANTHIERAEFEAQEKQCLAEAVYFEARSEPYVGQKAVAEVVLNRVAHKAYPGTICGVVYQGSERVTGCQFSFTCDGSMEVIPSGKSWERSVDIAEHAILGFAKPLTGRATHYHTTAVNPVWSSSLKQTRQIGTHIFYKFRPRGYKAPTDDATDA